jgi:hypothetical protein
LGLLSHGKLKPDIEHEYHLLAGSKEHKSKNKKDLTSFKITKIGASFKRE